MTRSTPELVSEVIESWRTGSAPDAAGFLASHPEIGKQKSFVLDLALEEFCLRRQAGEPLTPSTFCDRFPTYRQTLSRLLEVEEYFSRNSVLRAFNEVIEWPQMGETFCGFALQAELGRGSFSRVYLAKEVAVGDRNVAVKLTAAGDFEAHALGKLTHPNVVPVYSTQQAKASGLTVVCMPFLGTATLDDVLDRGGLRASLPARSQILYEIAGDDGRAMPTRKQRNRRYVDSIVAITTQLADALDYMHSRGVLHCDLKPSNVLLTRQLAPMLLDFNLSRDFSAVSSRIGGTLPYMSPEQLRATFFRNEGSDDVIDGRTDIFGLGVLTYELLTGRLPFAFYAVPSERSEVEHILALHLRPPQSIRMINAEVDQQLERLVLQCLAYDASDRPQTAAEVAQRLRSLLTERYRIKRWLRQNRLLVSVSSTAVSALALGIVLRVASLPPVSQQAFQDGLRSFDRAEFSTAMEEFNKAAGAGNNSLELHFARGMASVRLQDFETASQHFRKAEGIQRSGEIEAMLAYCYCFDGSHQPSVYYALLAIDHGVANAAVMNNLGYCYFELGDLVRAQAALDRALELEPKLASALHNRALVKFRRALAKTEPIQNATQDIRAAIANSELDAHLCYDAACIFAFASKEDASLRVEAVEFLSKAQELGASIANIAKSSVFSGLRNDPEFAKIVARDVPTSTRKSPPVLLPVIAAVLPNR